jgi:hypothetical protein
MISPTVDSHRTASHRHASLLPCNHFVHETTSPWCFVHIQGEELHLFTRSALHTNLLALVARMKQRCPHHQHNHFPAQRPSVGESLILPPHHSHPLTLATTNSPWNRRTTLPPMKKGPMISTIQISIQILAKAKAHTDHTFTHSHSRGDMFDSSHHTY